MVRHVTSPTQPNLMFPTFPANYAKAETENLKWNLKKFHEKTKKSRIEKTKIKNAKLPKCKIAIYVFGLWLTTDLQITQNSHFTLQDCT